MTADPVAAGLQRYADFFAGLTPQSLDGLDALVTEDVHFRDPFNDVHGRSIMKGLFADMFRDCSHVKFRIDGAVREGDQAFLKWTFFYTPRRFGGPEPWQAIGVSELHFTSDGRVKAHLDHWDAGSQFYARLPIVGALVRWVRNRLRHS
ncbi:MAG: nuclear transport factor 2 family protein [Ferrovibrio sp.]|jgi:steroid delta-isomerase